VGKNVLFHAITKISSVDLPFHTMKEPVGNHGSDCGGNTFRMLCCIFL